MLEMFNTWQQLQLLFLQIKTILVHLVSRKSLGENQQSVCNIVIACKTEHILHISEADTWKPERTSLVLVSQDKTAVMKWRLFFLNYHYYLFIICLCITYMYILHNFITIKHN